MLKNKNTIITGASRGLGRTIAEKFVAAGANVLLCARNKESLLEVAESLKYVRLSAEQKILTCQVDVADTAQIDQLFTFAQTEFPSIDILVNNAGIQGPIGPMEENDWESWIATVNINLFGTAYMIKKAIPIMKHQGSGKVVNLSGGGATGPRPNYSAYAVAKTGIVRLTETIAKEVENFGIDINVIAPGAMNSRMLEETLAAGENAVGESEYYKALKQLENGGTPPEYAANLCIYLASAQSDGITGRLISAVWDDWENLHTHRDTLKHSDIYTIRRIIPQDRGDNWDKK